MWMARWGIFIDADDPVNAADLAQQQQNRGTSLCWTVTDLDTKETFVVDLKHKKVIAPK